MDDSDEHWDEILEMVKENNKRQTVPVTELDPERSATLRKNVFAQIEQHFDSTEGSVQQISAASDASQTTSVESKIAATLSVLKQRFLSVGKLPALASIAIVMISIGLFSNSKVATQPYFDVPGSLFNAGLESYVELANGGSRALTSDLSTRRTAFVGGVIQADLDVIDMPNDDTVAAIAANFPGFFDPGLIDEKNGSATENMISSFRARVNKIAENDLLKPWLMEGYLIEMIHLAAKNALTTYETDTLEDVLQHFRLQSDLERTIANSAGLNPKYLLDRMKIAEVVISENSPPEDIQQIVDVAGALKILAH